MPVVEVSSAQVYARIARETGLIGDTYLKRRSPALLIAALGGIRSERLDHAHLVLAARFPEYEPGMLERALYERHTVVRTWGVRGALQLVPTSQLELYLAAAAGTAARWRRFLDARSNLSTPARLRLLKRLCPKEVSRDGLREAIPDATTRLFMLREAAQAGNLVWKEGDGQQAVYVWTRDWLEKEIEPTRDFHELISRYLTTYGPVDAADLAGWLGVTVAAARKLMAKHRVIEIAVEGEDRITFLKQDDLDALRQTRKSKAKGWAVVPPGDPLLLANKTRYHTEKDDGDEEGVVLHDGRPVAAWTLGRDSVSLRELEPGTRKQAEKLVTVLLTQAGIQIELQEAGT